jgi:predicted CXXCH cytochrome family protein
VALACTLAFGLAAACGTPQQRYRILSFFFDGVPLPIEAERLGPDEEDGEAANAARAGLIRQFVPQDVVHAPYAEQACGECHDRMQFEIGGAGAQLCKQCHDDSGAPPVWSHPPVTEGECLTCHAPHRSKAPGLLRKPAVELCAECHDPSDQAFAARHGALDEPRTPCTACHSGHGGDRRAYLRPHEELTCAPCHRPALQPVRHPHGPVEAGLCSQCHQAHDPEKKFDLVQEGDPLCLRCHELAALEASGRHQGEAMTGCARCHAPHGSDRAGLLRPALEPDPKRAGARP